MYVSGDGTVQNPKIIELVPRRETPAECRPGNGEISANLPVLPETLISLKLLIREPVVNLDQIAAIVLSDLGAAIHVMDLSGREASSDGERFQRIEDCISSLDLHQCLESMSEQTTKWSANRAAIRGSCVHAREIAQLCESLALTAVDDVNPQNAYMVGMFHELGGLPGILNWGSARSYSDDEDLVGFRLATSWSLPKCVQDYFFNRSSAIPSCKWSDIVERAHSLSSRPGFPSLPKERSALRIANTRKGSILSKSKCHPFPRLFSDEECPENAADNIPASRSPHEDLIESCF
jgi:hypothetical protein